MLMVLLFAFLLNTINTLLAGGQFFVPLFPCFLFAHVSCSLQNKCLNTDIMFFFTRTNVMLSVQYCFDRIQSHVNVDMCIYLEFFFGSNPMQPRLFYRSSSIWVLTQKLSLYTVSSAWQGFETLVFVSLHHSLYKCT